MQSMVVPKNLLFFKKTFLILFSIRIPIDGFDDAETPSGLAVSPRFNWKAVEKFDNM